MALFCALSIKVPKEPVISPVSGFIFERKLIEEFISMYGMDPVSAIPLKIEQLVPVKNGKRSTRNFHRVSCSERDKLKQLKFEATQFENDLEDEQKKLKQVKLRSFACLNVIATLDKEIGEIDEYARNNNNYDVFSKKRFAQLERSPPKITKKNQDSLWTDYFKIYRDNSKSPSPEKKPPETPVKIRRIHDDSSATKSFANREENFKTRQQQESPKIPPKKVRIHHHFVPTKSFVNLHMAENSKILCLDIHRKNSKMASGGEDSRICVIDVYSDEIVSVLKGHEDRITKLAFHPSDDLLLSGSLDRTLRIWDVDDCDEMMNIIIHEDSITGLSFHPEGDMFLSCSLDRYWKITDIHRKRQVSKHKAQEGLTCAEFSHDGTTFAIGTSNSVIELWDTRQQRKIANFSSHSGSVNSTSFDSKNVRLATSDEDTCVRIWDLRTNSIFHSIEYSVGYSIKDTSFDENGKYFGVVGNDVKVYSCEKWEEYDAFGEHSAQITGVRFAPDSTSFVTSGEDGTIKLYEKLE